MGHRNSCEFNVNHVCFGEKCHVFFQQLKTRAQFWEGWIHFRIFWNQIDVRIVVFLCNLDFDILIPVSFLRFGACNGHQPGRFWIGCVGFSLGAMVPTAGPQEDKDMINRLVLEEMGSCLAANETERMNIYNYSSLPAYSKRLPGCTDTIYCLGSWYMWLLARFTCAKRLAVCVAEWPPSPTTSTTTTNSNNNNNNNNSSEKNQSRIATNHQLLNHQINF